MKESKKRNHNKIILIILIFILIICVGIDLVIRYVPLKDIFTKTVNYTTTKEVTVTDEGISESVNKLYDATVIVEVGTTDKLSGWGSGFVYKKDDKFGYILTNHHVVDGANNITVVMSDETEVKGELVGCDEYSDVAVLKVPVESIKLVAEIGKSEPLKVGDTVFAIGTPVSLEYSFTVTRGILSGKNRMVEMTSASSSRSLFEQQNQDSWYMNLLQIDASINSGNSGGPLANCNGEVVGITNSKLSSSATSGANIENMGFAIPIEDALNVATKLEENGKVVRPTLGVSMTSIEGAKYNNIHIPEDVKTGAVVVEVMANSSASEAGLQRGDVIIKFGEYEIKDYKYLKYYLYRYNVNDKVDVTYLRNGKEMTTQITLKS